MVTPLEFQPHFVCLHTCLRHAESANRGLAESYVVTYLPSFLYAARYVIFTITTRNADSGKYFAYAILKKIEAATMSTMSATSANLTTWETDQVEHTLKDGVEEVHIMRTSEFLARELR